MSHFRIGGKLEKKLGRFWLDPRLRGDDVRFAGMTLGFAGMTFRLWGDGLYVSAVKVDFCLKYRTACAVPLPECFLERLLLGLLRSGAEFAGA